MSTLRRLATCACDASWRFHAHPGFPPAVDWTNFSFKDLVLRYEAHFIRLALRDAGGRTTRAAHLLGFKHHQTLLNLLKGRHQELRQGSVAVPPRKRSIIRSPPAGAGSDKEIPGKARTVRILHVEDNEVVADAVKETLELEGWEVDTCSDGATALQKILSDDHYDLLLLDYDLPGVSGIELVRRARGAIHRQDTPIIVLSAALGEAEARVAGANKFLHKPDDIKSLVETISGLVR